MSDRWSFPTIALNLIWKSLCSPILTVPSFQSGPWMISYDESSVYSSTLLNYRVTDLKWVLYSEEIDFLTPTTKMSPNYCTHSISTFVPLQVLHSLWIVRSISNEVDIQSSHLGAVHAVIELQLARVGGMTVGVGVNVSHVAHHPRVRGLYVEVVSWGN